MIETTGIRDCPFAYPSSVRLYERKNQQTARIPGGRSRRLPSGGNRLRDELVVSAPMPQDKQLHGIRLDDVLEKRRLDQALNAKEFAVLAGVGYSTAREWFRLPGFPVLHGLVFWGDFVEWRRNRTGLNSKGGRPVDTAGSNHADSPTKVELMLSRRAARILSEAG